MIILYYISGRSEAVDLEVVEVAGFTDNDCDVNNLPELENAIATRSADTNYTYECIANHSLMSGQASVTTTCSSTNAWTKIYDICTESKYSSQIIILCCNNK